jgi:cob(I)alamin adenosyltransferase
MVIVFTGNGKGKTTAALGQMMRALGRGKSALMIQFIKGQWRSGEDEFAEQFSAKDARLPPACSPRLRESEAGRQGRDGQGSPPETCSKGASASGGDAPRAHASHGKIQGRFKIVKMGLGFAGILGDKLPLEKHQKAAEKALEYFKSEAVSGKWHLIVLDEVNVAVSLGLLSVQNVSAAIKDFPQDKILILTGRDAPKEFIDAADLVTEMKEIKHPFAEGKKAKPAIEF